MEEKECEKCDRTLADDGTCPNCIRVKKFRAFAMSNGLTRYPDPSGERYVCGLDGSVRKKSESAGFMDELWDVLVKAKGGDKTLFLGDE